LFHARRPLHPDRLHTAIHVLLDAVVRTRGRLWLATQPDIALWLESAGGALQISHAGTWLAAADAQTWDAMAPERQA
jgi:G3E family GTPase